MRSYSLRKDSQGQPYLLTHLSGRGVMGNPLLNKSCGFDLAEREEFGLLGQLPQQVETIEGQAKRHYQQFCTFKTDLERNIYLNALYNSNEILFYQLVSEHLEEMLPVIYTPTVGLAVERFSMQFRRTRGLYLAYKDKHRIDALLAEVLDDEIELVVITDGSAVLGIGDQGIGGMAISIGKVMVYCLVGGINPHRVLPIQLDVGTDNAAQLENPFYLGARHPRISGPDYDRFIDDFITSVKKFSPNAYLHWEDFAREPATKILSTYKDNTCTFNDDIQGTGAVTLACILAAMNRANYDTLSEQRIVILGAGSAAIGIADQLVDAMVREGTSLEDARKQFWLLNSRGLLTDSMLNLNIFQTPYCRLEETVSGWHRNDKDQLDLLEVVRQVKPTILIGCSTVKDAFTQDIVELMAQSVKRPIILPLSNPIDRSEGNPAALLHWTKGQALVATGSPFAPVVVDDVTYEIAQCNNAFIFPAIGLGVTVAKATRLTDSMLLAASKSLAEYALEHNTRGASLLPPLHLFPEYSKKIALAVAKSATEEGVSRLKDGTDLEGAIDECFWKPCYYPLRREK